jgi:hypothetical protein
MQMNSSVHCHLISRWNPKVLSLLPTMYKIRHVIYCHWFQNGSIKSTLENIQTNTVCNGTLGYEILIL